MGGEKVRKKLRHNGSRFEPLVFVIGEAVSFEKVVLTS